MGAAGLCIAACFFHPLGNQVLIFAAQGFIRSVPFLVLTRSMNGLMSQDKPVVTSPEDLTPGAVLTEDYLKKLKNAAPDFYKENLKKIYPDGLSAEQTALLKNFLGADGAPAEELSAVSVHASAPFAGWISGGALLTLGFNGENVVTIFRSVFNL